MSGLPTDRRLPRGPILLLAGGWMLAACATVAEQESTTRFACGRGPDVTIRIAGDAAHLEGLEGGALRLERRGPGYFAAQSATRGAVLNGQHLTITIGRMAPIRCRPAGNRAG